MKSEPHFPAPVPNEVTIGAPPRLATVPPPSPATLDFALLRGAIEEIPFGVAATRSGVLHYANETLIRLFAAPPRALEGKPLADLFTRASITEISRALERSRVFDGRATACTFDGREIEVDVHIEVYRSSAQGSGGFLVVRDVSLELGTLRRLVEQLGGALFRVRLSDGALDAVSPTIARLTGLDAAKCVARPVLLTTLVSDEERERIAFLYRRLAKGELAVASAQVNMRRPDGVTRLVQIRAAACRDLTGAVRHIDGVLIDAARDPETEGAPDARRAAHDSDPTARAAMELTYELLREASQHVNVLGRELRALRGALKPHLAALPPEAAQEIAARLDALAVAAGAVGGLNRGLRNALARATLGATLGELLENVRATLATVIGDRVLTVDEGDAGELVLPEYVDELALALNHLALRAFRFAGSGTLRITARRAPQTMDARRQTGRRPEREQVHIELLGAAPTDVAESPVDASDILRAVPRPDEADVAYVAAQIIIGAAGGTIEADEATFATAGTIVRLGAG